MRESVAKLISVLLGALASAACGSESSNPELPSSASAADATRAAPGPAAAPEAQPAPRPPAAPEAASPVSEPSEAPEPAAEAPPPVIGESPEGLAAPAELILPEARITELRRALETRLVTPPELTELYLARIAAFDAGGPALNAVLHLNPNAVAEATALGESCATPAAPPLCGIPVLLKDNIDTADMPTTAGTLALEGSQPERDAFVTRRLRDAGAVILGKATLTELANFLTTGMPSGYGSLAGFAFNPYDPRPAPGGDGRPVLTPGGSSSGSAIAVSANLAAAALGTETSGSILSPASSNGVVGIKPTVGLISRAGILPISADQDTAGPLARSVEDAALLLGVLAGPDEVDPATAACLEPGRCWSDYTQFLDAGALNGARIALAPFPESREQILLAAVEVLEAAGATVQSVAAIPPQRGTCVDVPASPSCSTVLLYGFKRDLDAYLAATPAAPVRSLAELITFNAATDGALAYGQRLALAAQSLDTSPGSADTQRYQSDLAAARQSARDALDSVLSGADGQPATSDDFDALLFSENLGAAAPAVAGYPSITVPGGFVSPSPPIERPFPSGVTFTGPAFSEPRLIALAHAFEQAAQHRRPPDSTPPLESDRVQRQ